MIHRNAPLTLTGRLRLARCVVDDGWPLRRAAERFQVSHTTAARWAGRYRSHGHAGMNDRSSRPHHQPSRSTCCGCGANTASAHCDWPTRAGVAASTAHRILQRHDLPALSACDRATGEPVRRYERARPGELVPTQWQPVPGHGMTSRRGRGPRGSWNTARMTLDRRAELGEFLRSRRARLHPEDLGLPDYGGRRRVPGLRREELARLAGVSVDHYVRQPQRVRPGLRRLLDLAADVPAYIVGRNTDVLAWNRLAAALITDFGVLPPRQRNLARLVFLDEGMRGLYADWRGKAGDVAAYLRLDAGRHPDDPRTAELLTELSDASPEFREAWAEHRLKDKTHGRYVYRHPVVGELDLGFETLRLPDDPDQALIAHTVEEDSPSHTALRLLAGWAHETLPTG